MGRMETSERGQGRAVWSGCGFFRDRDRPLGSEHKNHLQIRIRLDLGEGTSETLPIKGLGDEWWMEW